jgi:hypothetical protein
MRATSGAEPVADLLVRASALRGHRRAGGTGAARHRRIPGAVHRSGLRRGRDGDHRRRGTARQGERSHRRHERGLAPWASSTRYCPTACASRAVPVPAFGGGEIDSLRRSSHGHVLRRRQPARGGAHRIRDVANVATSFPGFVALARSVGLDLRRKADRAHGGDAGVPVMTIDGPSGSGQGHGQPRRGQGAGLGLLDSGALYRLVAWPGRRAGIA